MAFPPSWRNYIHFKFTYKIHTDYIHFTFTYKIHQRVINLFSTRLSVQQFFFVIDNFQQVTWQDPYF